MKHFLSKSYWPTLEIKKKYEAKLKEEFGSVSRGIITLIRMYFDKV